MDLSKRFEIGDYVRFTARASNYYPCGVNTYMELLKGEVFEVVDTWEAGKEPCVYQRIEIGLCPHTKDPALAAEQMGWNFSSPMFELAEEFKPNRSRFKMSFDDFLKEVVPEEKEDVE